MSRGPPQKSPGCCRARRSPGQRAALPRAASGSWEPPWPWPARPHKLPDLTCLCAPLLPLHVPTLLLQQQVRAAVCFLHPPLRLLSRCLCVPGSGRGPPRGLCPAPRLPSCPLSPRRGAHPSSRIPDHAYRVCVRTRTSPDLKILRHGLEQLSNRNISLQHLFVLITSNAPAVARY